MRFTRREQFTRATYISITLPSALDCLHRPAESETHTGEEGRVARQRPRPTLSLPVKVAPVGWQLATMALTIKTAAIPKRWVARQKLSPVRCCPCARMTIIIIMIIMINNNDDNNKKKNVMKKKMYDNLKQDDC